MTNNIPVFVYAKYLGRAISPYYGDEVAFALFTVRSVPGKLIENSTIIGRLRGTRYWSYEGEFGTNFDPYSRDKLAELARAEFYGEEIAKFEPYRCLNMGRLRGVIAYDEQTVVTTAYKAGYRPWPEEKKPNSESEQPWIALQDYWREQHPKIFA